MRHIVLHPALIQQPRRRVGRRAGAGDAISPCDLGLCRIGVEMIALHGTNCDTPLPRSVLPIGVCLPVSLTSLPASTTTARARHAVSRHSVVMRDAAPLAVSRVQSVDRPDFPVDWSRARVAAMGIREHANTTTEGKIGERLLPPLMLCARLQDCDSGDRRFLDNPSQVSTSTRATVFLAGWTALAHQQTGFSGAGMRLIAGTARMWGE